MPIKVGETLKNQDLPQESICMIILAISTVCFVASNSVKLCAPLAIHKKTPIIKLLLKLKKKGVFSPLSVKIMTV